MLFSTTLSNDHFLFMDVADYVCHGKIVTQQVWPLVPATSILDKLESK